MLNGLAMDDLVEPRGLAESSLISMYFPKEIVYSFLFRLRRFSRLVR